MTTSIYGSIILYRDINKGALHKEGLQKLGRLLYFYLCHLCKTYHCVIDNFKGIFNAVDSCFRPKCQLSEKDKNVDFGLRKETDSHDSDGRE